jgi:signal transduction histidine kinase
VIGALLDQDPGGRARLVGRLAAALFIGSGILLLVNVPLPGPPDLNRVGELVVSALAIAIGVGALAVPWERLHPFAGLTLAAPALALIALGNLFAGSNPPYVYGVFFVVVFMWMGIGFPRWTSLLVSPLALVAYVVPILFLPGNVGYGVSTAAITIPICVLVGETLAWGLSRLGRTEAALKRSQRDYKEVYQSTRQYAQAYQRQMEVTERLRSIDKMKDTFLQAVSHDLRSPLTAILGSAVTLEQSEYELSDQDRADLLQRIAANARKLDRLLSDLLDTDRLQRGIVAPDRRPTELGELVRAVVAEPEVVGRRRVDVSVEGEPLVADVDRAKVERIVENLVSNAAKHTPAGARVWVAARADGDGILLVVDDDGHGVPEDARDVIFQPFRRGPGTEDVPGVGLGLSLVSRFAQLHDGRAWVEDRPGGGASFRVHLRARVDAAREQPTHGSPATPAAVPVAADAAPTSVSGDAGRA